MRTTDNRLSTVDGLENVDVELFSRRYPDIESVPLDSVVDALGIDLENILPPLSGALFRERRSIEPRRVDSFSVSAEAAPLKIVAAKSLISARSSVLIR